MLTVEKPRRRVPLRLFFTVSQVIICNLTHHKAVLGCSVHRNRKSIFKEPKIFQFPWKRAATVFFPKEGANNFICLKLQSFHFFLFHSYGYLKEVPFTSVSAQVCWVLIFTCNDQMQIILFSMNRDSKRVTKRIKQIHLVKISVSEQKYAGKTRQLRP